MAEEPDTINERLLLERLKAEVALEEANKRLATKRLALAEAELSNQSLNDSSLIKSPAKKINKTKAGDGDPPGDDPAPDRETVEYSESVHISSGLPSAESSIASPIIEQDEVRPTEHPMLPDRKSTRLNSSHSQQSRMPSSA